jgi:formate dehydrogenase subunit gamma
MSHATDSGSATSATRTEAVRRIAAEHARERGALMVVLHGVMEELGHIERADVMAIADELNLSVAEVHGVVSFYKDFRTSAPPAHSVHLCRGEACQAVGAEALYAGTTARFADREDVEVEQVFCFGNCALGPSGMLDGRLHGRLSPTQIEGLTAGWQA